MGHSHTHSHVHTNKRLGWTILFNIVITLVEYIGGIMSGSLALISDAGHNFSDVLSLILGYFGEKVSTKKSDDKHTFGFKRFEVLVALINALSLFAIGFYILYESFHRFSDPQPIVLSIMIGVGMIGLLGNFLSIVVLNNDRDKNLNMRAVYLHLFYDTISSVFVIFSAVIIYFTKFYLLDVIVSFFIAIMIFWSAFDILKESLHLIMQGVPNSLNYSEIYGEIISFDEVEQIHNLHIWAINSNEFFLSSHVCVSEKFNSNNNLLKKINKSLESKFNIKNSAIQIEIKNMCSSSRGEK